MYNDYTAVINLTDNEVEELISDENQSIIDNKKIYFDILTNFKDGYQSILLNNDNDDNDNGRLNKFLQNTPLIILNAIRLYSIGELKISEFLSSEISRINNFDYDFKLIVVNDNDERSKNILKNTIKKNIDIANTSNKFYFYILHSIMTNGSHYSVVLQNGNNVNVISLDPTGLITPSDKVF